MRDYEDIMRGVLFALLFVLSLTTTAKAQTAMAKLDNGKIMAIKGLAKTIEPSKRYSIQITVKNSGSTVWTRDANYRLGFGNLPNYKSGKTFLQVVDQKNRPELDDNNRGFIQPDKEVKSGEEYVFELIVETPKKAGTYTIGLRMLIENGQAAGEKDGWFGELYKFEFFVADSKAVGLTENNTSNATNGTLFHVPPSHNNADANTGGGVITLGPINIISIDPLPIRLSDIAALGPTPLVSPKKKRGDVQWIKWPFHYW